MKNPNGSTLASPGGAYQGLTKREVFAMAAMKAMVTSFTHTEADEIAEMAVDQADALLNELEKEG